MSSRQASSTRQHPFDHEGPSPFHPLNVIMILTLIGIAVLFLAFSGAFIYSRMQAELPPVDVPWMFGVNSLVLLASSYTIGLATKAFKADDTEKYKKALLYTMGLSALFLVLQIIAWQMLFAENIFPSTDNSAGYLYVLSGLHFAHVIAGLPFIVGFFWVARKRMKEPVSVLVYFSDPEKRLKLKMLTMYWHFMDALWIYLVVFLFINRMMY
jgi:cytochrome c oxidase subunit 3